MVVDVNGQEIAKGDVVAPLNGDFRGRVSDVKSEDGEGFVCIRPAHRPYSKGIWYASEHVQWLSAARVPKEEADKKGEAKKDEAKKGDAQKDEAKAKNEPEAKAKTTKKKAKKAKTSKSKKSTKSK